MNQKELKRELQYMTQDVNYTEITSHNGEELKRWCLAWQMKMMSLISQIKEGD